MTSGSSANHSFQHQKGGFMIRQEDIEVRTDDKNILICKVRTDQDGRIYLLCQHGKKEDQISLERFLCKAVGAGKR